METAFAVPQHLGRVKAIIDLRQIVLPGILFHVGLRPVQQRYVENNQTYAY